MNLKSTQVFTPEWVTNEMLNLLDQDDFCKDETFYLEPSCGDGQMLVVILDRIYHSYLFKTKSSIEESLAFTLGKYYAIELDPEMATKARVRIALWARSKLEPIKDVTRFEELMIANNVIHQIICDDVFNVLRDRTKDERKFFK